MVTAILLGAGDRGWGVYGQWALRNPGRIKFIAVAEPNESRRRRFADEHNIPAENCYTTWENVLDKKKFADVCFVATQDQMHTEPVLKALDKGYHVMVEKPMATTPEDCYKINHGVEKSGKQLWIAHVLRYTPFFYTIKKVVDEGRIGKIINISHSENISYWHFAHSYVRGNWRSSDMSSPIILAKTCHDLDIIYWLAGSPVKKINSFGNLNYYRPENAPEGSTKRCLDGCAVADTCQWYAPRLYIKAKPLLQVGLRSRAFYKRYLAKAAMDYPGIIKVLSKLYPPVNTLINWNVWPVSVITNDYSYDAKIRALKEGPFGRCVFHCDNDVCDNQTVNIEFENNITATLTVHGFASFEGRWIRIEGTGGTLFGKFTAENQEILLYDHHNVKKRVLMNSDLTLQGHLGGDDGIMTSLVNSVESEYKNTNKGNSTVLTSGEASLESHLMAFAAESSRKEGKVVFMEDIRKNTGGDKKMGLA